MGCLYLIEVNQNGMYYFYAVFRVKLAYAPGHYIRGD